MAEPLDVRNLTLFGHSSTGKTAFVDALAVKAKVTGRRGDSAEGTSISNSDPEEKERKHTLGAHLFHLPVDKLVINVLDTPGHPDFVADVISAMQVAETGVLFISAASGVTFHARRMWDYAGRAGLARMVVMTHLDHENADFDETLAAINAAFGDVVAPITYPDAAGADFSGVHDVLKGEGPRAQEFRERLEERVAEADDEVLEAYLENGTITQQQLEEHFIAALLKGKVVPLFVLTPNKDVGLDALLEHVAALAPDPVTFGARNAAAPGSDSYQELVQPDAGEPFVARVFKVVVDPYVGRISYLRCFRGTLHADEGFFNVRIGRHEKVGGLLRVRGKDTEPVPEVRAGDLFAVSKLESLCLGDTVTTDANPLQLPPAEYPPPTYSLAVVPQSRGDEGKIGEGLEKLTAEDPTFTARRDPITAELVVSGMSPLHLDVQLTRLKRRYGVATEHHKPRIPYRETIMAKADGHHRHKKQTGGRGQFAEVYLRAAPRQHGEGFEFVDSVVGGAIPRQFIPEVEKGVRRFLEKGGLAGCPVVDVQAEVYDGKFHDVDSDQISFQLAGERAFADAFSKAKPALLEPIMNVEIHVPERFTGDVAGNLSSHRGRMAGMEIVDGIQVIRAQVPLKEMQDYATQLRSITAGEGTFTMEPAGYEQVPPNLQQEIVAAHKQAAEHH